MLTGFDPSLVELLQKLVFFERASAHVLAGCLPNVRSFAIKRLASRDLYDCMRQACALREWLVALGHKSADLLMVSRDWVDAMRAIDGSPEVDEAVFALYTAVKPRLIPEYVRVLAQADRLVHAPLVQMVRAHLSHARFDSRRASATIRRSFGRRPVSPLAAEVEDRWRTRGPRELPLDEAIWGPRRRAPAALRPHGLIRGQNGALPIMPVDALRDRKSIGIFLHNNINEEYTTLELMGRNSYEHPDLPWPFHLSMARQVSDEARHAEMQQRLARRYGVKYGDYPVYVTTYDLLYAFEPCPAGGKRELLWRLLLRSTYQEALSLDSMMVEIERRRHLSQEDIARTFNYLLVDELFHVENGLRWSRALAEAHGLDVLKERELARDYYIGMENHKRLEFMVNHPKKARAEGRHLRRARQSYDLPFKTQLSVGLRRRAGFSEEEIGQVRDWRIYE
jgi:uncharacterized ferritin-like protein (DUF455 family)